MQHASRVDAQFTLQLSLQTPKQETFSLVQLVERVANKQITL
jgi:hypothetical protein